MEMDGDDLWQDSIFMGEAMQKDARAGKNALA
jgi:hypothetical protein